MVVNRKTSDQMNAFDVLDLNSVKYAIDFRYGLMNYIYTQFFRVHNEVRVRGNKLGWSCLSACFL